MATIDRLEIQIAGSAKNANDAIDSLITNLGRLAKSLKIDTSGLEKIGKSLNFSGVDKAAKNVQSQTQKVSKSLSQITEQYKDLGKGFEIKGSTQQIQKQIDSLTNQLAKAKLAKEDFGLSGKADLGGYEIAVKNVIKYTNQIESLKNQLLEMQTDKPVIDFKITGIENAEEQISNITEKLRTASLPPSAFNYNADAMKAVFGEAVAGIENWSQATQKFGANAGAVLNQTTSETDELKARTEQFEQSLKNLRIPPINTDNINVLQRELEKSEANFEKLKVKLANGITMGQISANVDDKKYRNLREQMALAEKTAEALRDRINEIGKASQGAAGIKEVGNASDKTSDSFSKLSKNTLKATNSLKKMQSGLKGILRAFLPILGIRELVRFGKESIKSSMDYLEVLNYFDAAFGQVASNADLGAFEEMGYDSADAYYNSFAKRAQELTAKMSGFSVGEGGLLESTGAVSLGLDPSQLMNYQAMFGQMSSSMGVASETALKLSQALTEIGADLASVKNMDFESVWNDMASGLAGMSRTLDKYGVNIRNVNLQQKLNELGINANITALNQNDKALLRAIILLESTKYAWGDLSNTLNAPSNQLRLIQANFQNLARTIGNLFLPIVKTVLPYINALIIAVQRLFSWLGNLIGIDISDISTSIGGTDIGGILDQTDDLSDSLGGVAENAKKAKAGLRAFDELKTISMPEESKGGAGAGGIGGGLLDAAFEDAFSKYQKEWNKAFASLENRAQEVADKIEKAFEPIKKIIQDFAIGDFFQAGKDVSALVVSITDFIADAIDKVDWYGIGKKIGEFFEGIDWLSVLKSAGNLIWQALKAAFELYVGAFSSAPLETALVSLVAFPKLLKAITASKFITGIGKLWKSFGIWGEKIQLVAGTLTGNKAAASGLSMLYPKLGAKVDAVKSSFVNFFTSVKTNGFWKTVDGGITNIRNSLGGLQKAAIVSVAGFAEFSIVSSSVEKLTLGTENWLAEIGKIAGVAAAAGAAMYVALGPAGLAIAAITGVAAAVKGINDAFDTIRAQEIGETIKNAMSNPGGVPLSEITSNFANALSEAATGFDTINEKSSEMKSVQKNIENTWTEIYKIQEAMENGVLSVEEGKAQLETLFSELATLTEQKFSTMNTVIMSAYGEGGSFRTALENMGADTESAIDTMIIYGYQNSERAKEIAQELAGMDINSEKYKTLTAELTSLTGEMSKFEQATSNFTYDMNSLQGKIDYSEIFLPDGSIDTEALQSYLNEATTALSDYESSIDDAGKEISQYWQEIYNSTTATDEQKDIAQANLEYIPQAIESMKKDAELQIVGFTDTMQNEFLARTSQIIDDSVAEWESKNAFEKWWNGIWGAGTKGEYVKEALDQQQANIEEVSSAIEESLGSLQTEGVVWANDAAKEIYGALFDSEYIHSEVGIGHYKYTLNEDYREVIEGATEGIADLASERGKDAVDGYANGISDNTNTAESSAKTFVERVMEIIAKTQDSHSPSRVTKEFGKNAVEGYNLGISENQNSTFSKISEYTRRILEKFSEIISPFRQIGANAMSGLQNGLSSMEGSLYAKAQSIAQNIANTIKTALDIHSPSKVMFELGDYTMQGFQNGLENLYKPIISSAKMFSRDLQVASAPNISDMYRGYQNQTVYTPQYDVTEYTKNGYDQSNAETNALLRRQNELLEKILAKPNLGDRDVFDAVRTVYKGEAIRRYGNSAAFDPVLG